MLYYDMVPFGESVAEKDKGMDEYNKLERRWVKRKKSNFEEPMLFYLLNRWWIKGCEIINIYHVYQKYNKDFIAFAKSITQNNDRALDLVQDAYVAGIEREETFSYMNEYQIKGWFFTTIKNKNIDFIRKQKRLTFIDEEDIKEGSETFEAEVEIKELLMCLPETHRKVVWLRYQMNLNSTEIGKIMNLSPSTIRSRLSSSINILKDNLYREE